MQNVYVVLSMDCEPARPDVTAYGWKMSGSGPADYEESERSIRGYAAIAKEHGFALTLFVHPEVALGQPELFLELQSDGACLGLHLHPYKFAGGRYRFDLGYYSADEQRALISQAAEAWEKALDQWPRYFRGGVFSANDNTFRVLSELGFKGGSVSIPGRVLPEAYAVWAGAEPYPHRANLNFRQVKGESGFVEIPVAVSYQRPTARGDRGEQGYEWLYIPSNKYNHRAVVHDLLERFLTDSPSFGTIVTDTHNNMDFSDPEHHATKKLRIILEAIRTDCQQMKLPPVGTTVERLRDLVMSANETD